MKTRNKLNPVANPAEFPRALTGISSPIRSHATGPMPTEYAAMKTTMLMSTSQVKEGTKNKGAFRLPHAHHISQILFKML